MFDAIAESIELPSMADVYDELTAAGRGLPPSQQSFLSRCRDECERDYPAYLNTRKWPGIEARLLRAHSSFTRERHLQKILEEAGIKCGRSPVLDQDHGTDLVVVHGRYSIQLALFLGSTRGWAHWERKRRSHHDSGVYLAVPLIDSHRREINGYWLYGPSYVPALQAQLAELVSSPEGFYELRLPGNSPDSRPGI